MRVFLHFFYRAIFRFNFFIVWTNMASVIIFKISFSFDTWKLNLSVELYPIEVLLFMLLFFFREVLTNISGTPW